MGVLGWEGGHPEVVGGTPGWGGAPRVGAPSATSQLCSLPGEGTGDGAGQGGPHFLNFHLIIFFPPGFIY